jgi:hypothetical protein
MYSVDARTIAMVVINPLFHTKLYDKIQICRNLPYYGIVKDILSDNYEMLKQQYEELSGENICKCDLNFLYKGILEIRCQPIGFARGILIDLVISDSLIIVTKPRLEDEFRMQLLMYIYNVQKCHVIIYFRKIDNPKLTVIELKRNEDFIALVENKLDLLSDGLRSPHGGISALKEIDKITYGLHIVRQYNFLEVAF